MHRHDQVLKLIGSLYYKSLILTGEDFFLFRDPSATPALAFLFPGAAVGTAGLGVATMGEVLIFAAARPAAGIGPSSGTGSPARISHDVAASAPAADPLGILLTITLGAIPGFITQHSFGAATGPSASTGCPSLAAAGTAADTAAVAATGSTAADSPVNTPAADSSTAAGPEANTDSVSLTGPTAAAGSATGATAADSAAGTDSSTTVGSTAATCPIAGAGDRSPAGSAAGPAAAVLPPPPNLRLALAACFH